MVDLPNSLAAPAIAVVEEPAAEGEEGKEFVKKEGACGGGGGGGRRWKSFGCDATPFKLGGENSPGRHSQGLLPVATLFDGDAACRAAPAGAVSLGLRSDGCCGEDFAPSVAPALAHGAGVVAEVTIGDACAVGMQGGGRATGGCTEGASGGGGGGMAAAAKEAAAWEKAGAVPWL